MADLEPTAWDIVRLTGRENQTGAPRGAAATATGFGDGNAISRTGGFAPFMISRALWRSAVSTLGTGISAQFSGPAPGEPGTGAR